MKNNEKKESIVKNIFSKDIKGEKIILFIMSIIAIVIGVLILTGVWKVEEGFLDNEYVPIILLVLGIICFIISIFDIIRIKKDETAFKQFFEDYENKRIKNILVDKGIDNEIEVIYDKKLKYISVRVNINEGFDIYLSIDKYRGYHYGVDCNPYTNLYELLSVEEEAKLDDIWEDHDYTSDLEAKKVYAEFYDYVIKYQDFAKELYEKYKDQIEFVEE